MFDPERFLWLAIRLVEQVNDEETLRTVISRAYYAAFLTARAGLGKEKWPHGEVWTEVEKFDSEKGRRGHRLRKLRKFADYADPLEDLREAALMSIEDATILVAFASTLQPNA